MLRLAVDVEKITRDLFRQLVMQLIHWFTKNSRGENPDSMALLNACMEAAASSAGPLRDFGAECTAEFLKYSIKHLSAKSLEENPLNVKSLLKRVYQFCQDAGSAKRVGAALIVNRIYKILREEESLVDQFSLELLRNLLDSLLLAEGDHPALGSGNLTKVAIEHISKIIKKKSDLFMAAKATRRWFEEGRKADLGSLVDWLFEQFGRVEVGYTHQCMILFIEFSSEFTTPRTWLSRKLAADSDYLISNLESARFQETPNGSLAASESRTWLMHYVAALEGYSFLCDCGAMEQWTIWENKNSKMIDLIDFFFKTFANVSVGGANTVLTPTEVVRLNTLRSTAIVKSFLSVQLALSKQGKGRSKVSAIDGILGTEFFGSIASCVFRPAAVGFDMDSEEVKQHLPERLKTLLRLLWENMAAEQKKVLLKALGKEYWGSGLDIAAADAKAEESMDYTVYAHAVGGLALLEDVSMFDAFIDATVQGKNYRHKLFSSLKGLAGATEPSNVLVAEKLLGLCLKDANLVGKVWEELLSIGDAKKNEDGLRFYHKFSETIHVYVATHFPSFVQATLQHSRQAVVLSIVQGVFEYLIANKLRKQQECLSFMKDFTTEAIFLRNLAKQIDTLHGRQAVLQLWRKIFQFDRRILQNSGNSDLNSILTSTFVLLLRRGDNLSAKNEALDMVPWCLTDQKAASEIEELLSDIVINYFPMSVTDLVEGTTQFNDYVTAIRKFLNTITISPNTTLPIVRSLVGHICRDADHRFANHMKKAIESVVPRMDKAYIAELDQYCFKFLQNDMYPMEVRRNLATQVLLPMLNAMQPAYVRDIFVREIATIMKGLQEPASGKMKELKDQLIKKATYFDLLRMCYDRLPLGEVHSATAAIVVAFHGPNATGKELSTAIMKIGAAAKNERVPPEEPKELAPLRLIYHQTAYITLASVINTTQKDKKDFYNTLTRAYLFKENPAKGEYQWSNLIDVNDDIRLRSEFQSELERPMLKIRMEEYRTRSALTAPEQTGRRAIQYLSSMYLADSSLSASIGFLGAGSLANTDGEDVKVPKEVGSSLGGGSLLDDLGLGSALSQTIRSESEQGTLDLDFFNQNPCMPSLMEVMGILHGMDPNPQAGSRVDDMPPWMQEVYRKMTEADLHINVRLFLAKLLINQPRVFLPFAEAWWQPLAQLIADSDLFSEGCINYFVQDLAVLLLVWIEPSEHADSGRTPLRPPATYENKKLVYDMLRTLSKNAHHQTKSVINNNRKIIEGFVENWKDLVIPPTEVIYGYLAGQPVEKTKVLTGLYLTSTMAVNGIAPYNETVVGSLTLGEAAFNQSLVNHLTNRYKDVYGPCAEVIGQLLQAYDSRIDDSREELESLVQTQLSALGALQALAPDQERFVYILNRMSVAFPRIVGLRAKELLFLLPRLIGPAKAFCLEALASRADHIEHLFEDLAAKNLLGILEYRDDDCQTYALVNLFTIASSLTWKQVSTFLETAIRTFASHPSARCRQAFYTLIIRLHAKDAQTPEGGKDAAMTQLLKVALLRGLGDADEDIRRGLFEYVHRDTGFAAANVFSKMETIVSAFYAPEAEESFLGYGAYFLLEATKDSPTYLANLFESGLPDARFADNAMDIDISWANVASMQPLFAVTQDSGQVVRHP
ncbi:hypothetical protein HK097_007923 [Rhizophlyctis rosea]|uniref:DNA-dependent protein kinase catalytic subunit CC3 domain-containing protein n=1 Tax=Rhizophlyctis rosea TaxID=64517 RepID=A0AAD5SD74_9FUNG|nr:hypothetical protein HK097_007923 [Rhizophlyctis rosea]